MDLERRVPASGIPAYVAALQPDLLTTPSSTAVTVSDIASLVGRRCRTPQRRGIRAGLRLRKAVCADLPSRQHPRQPPPFCSSVPNTSSGRHDRLSTLTATTRRTADRRRPTPRAAADSQPRSAELGEHPLGIGLGLPMRNPQSVPAPCRRRHGSARSARPPPSWAAAGPQPYHHLPEP